MDNLILLILTKLPLLVFLKEGGSWEWWHTPIVPAVRRAEAWRSQVCASLNDIVILCLKITKLNKYILGRIKCSNACKTLGIVSLL